MKAISPAPALPVAAMSARRLLTFGGILLIVAGMLFGDLFAVFALHQNAGRMELALLAATQAVAGQNPAAVGQAFAKLGDLVENRGTKVDTHVHMTDVGYLALLLALIQPLVALSEGGKKRLAKWFLAGAVLLPVGIFLIHYVGVAYGPTAVIGWASIVADAAGALLILVLSVEAWGLGNFLARRATADPEAELFRETSSWEERALLSGGTLLVLVGFLYGAWYAAGNLREQEERETTTLKEMFKPAPGQARSLVSAYSRLQGEKAVEIAAHSHIIEFGILGMLLAFVQPQVRLAPHWKRRSIELFLAGSLVLPLFVLLELRLGLVAGAIADAGGLMVIAALIAMLVGLRRSSNLQAQTGSLA
ncbi:MAG: hypothetical protein JO159_19635 [Acidobacteria bacterium]|nr:hypothetical protein [Acidobacteriota bacterium]